MPLEMHRSGRRAPGRPQNEAPLVTPALVPSNTYPSFDADAWHCQAEGGACRPCATDFWKYHLAPANHHRICTLLAWNRVILLLSIHSTVLISNLTLADARTLNAIKRDGTLKVGLPGDYAPYAFRSGDGSIRGADALMAAGIARALGVALKVVPTTWASLQEDLLADRFDIAAGGITVTQGRAAVADFSVPLVNDGKRPIVRCADRHRFTTISTIDNPGIKVVTNPGGTNERFALANFTRATVRIYPDNQKIFDLLVDGRADVMITDGVEVDYQSRRHVGVLCPAVVRDSFDHTVKAYWMTRDSALKSAVDAYLTSALEAGEYDKALAASAE